MATGAVPSGGDTWGMIFEAVLTRAPAPAIRLNPDVPAELERIINRALEKDRELRYQHASDMRAELQRLRRDRDAGRSPSASSGAVVQDPTGQLTRPAALDSSGARRVRGSSTSNAPASNASASNVGVVEGTPASGKNWKILAPVAAILIAA